MHVNLIAPVFAILRTISKQSQFRGCTAVTGTIINKQALLWHNLLLRKDITEEILIRLHILYFIRTIHRIEIIADRMTVGREDLAVYPSRNIRVGIAEQD